MPDAPAPNRCRIVLIAPTEANAADWLPQLEAAAAGGDIASVILPQGGLDEAAFQSLAERIVPVAQQAGIAAVIAGDTRIAGRVKADGIHVEGGRQELSRVIASFRPRLMVGAGGARSRDEALDLGEERPDYMLFGRFGRDRLPGAHPRDIALGSWWAEMIQIPCIVMGGSEIASAEAVAATGAEFVGLSAAVFGPGVDARERVRAVNEMLDRVAPRFEY